ncbi:MAG: hypothetical protein M1835_008192 [Candelina submexicana]|nr:MAG: hypothetical protein M1835_008192 [Candelina submexicana]
MTSQALDYPCNPLRLNHCPSSTSDYYSDTAFDLDVGGENSHKRGLVRRLNSIAAYVANTPSPDDKTALALYSKLDGVENELGLPVLDRQGSLYTSPALEPVQEYAEDHGQPCDHPSMEEDNVDTTHVQKLDTAARDFRGSRGSLINPGEENVEQYVQQVVNYVEEAVPAEGTGLIQSRDYAPIMAPIASSSQVQAYGQRAMLEQSRQVLLRVSKVAAELRCRCEEMKHIHDLSTIRAEKAAQRIVALETDVTTLESGLEANASALTYLKLQLKVLEVQASPYIPLDDRDGLRAGIQRWKMDWADADMRFRERRRGTQAD